MTEATTTYRPQDDSLAGRVLAYFRRLPDEELSSKDIGLKFTVDTKNVPALLQKAVDTQMLSRDGTIYAAGAQINQATRPTAHNIFAGAPASTAARPSPRPPRRHIDMEALKVDDDVPCQAIKRRGYSKWAPLLDKLTRPGQSIAIPLDVKAAVAAAANKRHRQNQGKFRVANSGPNQARIWRVA